MKDSIVKQPGQTFLSSIPPSNDNDVPSTFAALRHRNFRLYFGGQLISNIGTWMQSIAQGWVVYQIGHSELTLGLVAFASAIPILLISPWAGVIVDRMSRRNLLLMTQTGAMSLALVLAGLTFTNLVQEWHIIVLAALLGVVSAFDAPARQTFASEMVGKEDLPNAIALISMMFHSARVIGPAIAGFVLAAVGAAWCFTLNGVSFIAVLIGLRLMILPPAGKIEHTLSPWQQMVDGMQYALHHRIIFALILLSLVFSVFGTSYATILPAYVEEVLHQGAATFGWINAAIGLGAVSGALLLANRFGHGQRGQMLVIANLTFPLILIAFALTSSFLLCLLLAFGLGVGFILQYTTINMLLQTLVEDDFRGRVMGFFTITFLGFAPFGNLLIGFLSEKMHLGIVMTTFAVCSLIFSGIIILKTPELKKLY
jgi:MFS family permease